MSLAAYAMSVMVTNFIHPIQALCESKADTENLSEGATSVWMSASVTDIALSMFRKM